MADLVLWEPAFFGAKPKLVIKGGLINWAIMGDPNASLPTPQPMIYRPMFGAFGSALAADLASPSSRRRRYEAGIGEKLGLQTAGDAGLRDADHHQAEHGPQRQHPRHRGRTPRRSRSRSTASTPPWPRRRRWPSNQLLLLQLKLSSARGGRP